MERNNPFMKDKTDFKLTMLTCDKYELECYYLDNVSKPYLFIRNIETGTYNLAGTLFYMVWDDIKEIKEDLLPTIDSVLEKDWTNEIIGNNYTLIDAIIDADKTYFIPSEDALPYKNGVSISRDKAREDETKHIDTKVFREIVLKWLKFLEGNLPTTPSMP